MSKLLVTLLALVLCASIASAAETPGQRPGEFTFDDLSGKQGGPNAFMKKHAIRQAWPANVDSAFRAQAAEKSWKSFEQVKFRGLSKGRDGVWQTVGPVTESDDELWDPKNSSGRVTDLATGVSCSVGKCRLYAGTAGGGLWRTDRALHPSNPGWEHLTDGLESNNIGAVTVDPNDASGMTLLVGTGESNFNYSSGAGKGVFRSSDGGDSFGKLPTMFDGLDFTATRGISQIAVKPGDPDTIYVATTTALLGMTSVRGGQSTITGGPQAAVGLYATHDAGASWELLFEAPINTTTSTGTPDGIFEILSGVKDVQLDPQDPDTVYISVADDGVYRSSPALDGDDDFHKIFQIVTSPGGLRTDSYAAFDLTVKDGKTRVYLYNGNGWDLDQQALYRLNDARVAHTALFNAGANTAAWMNMTFPLQNPEDYQDWRVCNAQCVYDLVVAVPEGRPDTVYLGGQLSWVMGDPTVRSTNGGESFTAITIDRQTPPGTPHVDVRAIVFSPDNRDIAFIGSDGGVVRSNGEFGDGTYHCNTTYGIAPNSFFDAICKQALAEVPEAFVFMNRGLQAMQLYNISADPERPLKRMMAGTQDNSTQWHDGTGSAKNWSKVFAIGDGTSANGFHATDPNILFASFQSNWFFTHFNGGEGGTNAWVFTSWPIQASGEASDPVGPSGRQFMTFDPGDADTQYTGFEHVWRTQNNGGDRAFLEADCTVGDLRSGAFGVGCGDWEPLGEFLTRSAFGTDREGGVIVAAERASKDDATLWAATSLGRVFVTNNVHDASPDVEFDRVDTAATPPRFISGIAVDSADPNRAFVSYSGFNAVTPDTPGHVFEVVYDGADAVFTSIDYNLGDIPITHLVRDDLTGDLYAATDFGVLVLPAGANAWEVAGKGLPAVLTPHLEIHPEKRILFAATHGLGAWYMNLGKLKKKK